MCSEDNLIDELESFCDNYNEECIYSEDEIPMLIDYNSLIEYKSFKNEDDFRDFIIDNNIKKLYSYVRINDNSKIYYKLGFQRWYYKNKRLN